MKIKYLLLVIAFCFSTVHYAQKTKKEDVANKENGITKIILLRHAEKGNDGSADPELTFKGEERAKKLAFVLEDFKIDKIFSTHFIRTEKTVTVLAVKKELEIATYDAKDQDFANFLLEKQKGKTIVVVGHSNTIPALVNKLIGKDMYKDLSESEYGKFWVLTFSNGTFIDCSLFNY